MKITKVLQYETYVVVGLLMIFGTLAKLIFDLPIDSDWFWFIAGVALFIDGYLDLRKQKQFSRKYKVVSKEEFENIWKELEYQKGKKK